MQMEQSLQSDRTARSRRFWMVVTLGSLTALAPLSIDMYLPALPMLAADLDTSASLTQLSLTLFLVGLGAGQIIAGPLSDARGRRGPLMIGLILYLISSVLCAVTSSIWVLLALRLVQGLSGAAGIVIARAIVRDLYEGTEMTKFFALLMLVNGAAPILAPIFGGQLLRVTTWHGVFVVLGLLGLMMLVASQLSLTETLPVERRSTGGIRKTLSTLRHLLRDRVFMGYAWAQGLVMAGMFAYIAGSPFVLQDLFGVSPQTFSLLFAVNGIGIIIAGQLAARLSVRYGELKVFVAGIALAAAGSLSLLVMILTGAGLFAVMVSLVAIVSSVGIVGPTGTSLAMQNQGKAAGSAAALIGVPPLFLGALVAPLVGIGGSETAVPMGAVIAVTDVGALLCYMLMIRGRN